MDYFDNEREHLKGSKGNENDKKALAIYEQFWVARKNGLGYIAEKDGKAILVPAPIVSFVDSKFHSVLGPAIQWTDEKHYFLHGVKFDYELWKIVVERTITPKEILSLQNQEQKSVALRVFGYDKAVEGMDAKVLGEKSVMIKGNPYTYQVIEVNLGDDEVPARFVKVKCFSTPKEYLLRVDPRNDECKEPIGALAWLAGIPKDEYSFEKET